MGNARAEITIDKPAAAVWAVVGDFGDLAGWMPGVESCVVDGDDRFLKIMGLEIVERLVSRDDDARVIVYGIVGGVPVGNHKATISVTGEGAGSRVTWDVEVEPDEMTDFMHQTYQQALEALKTHLA
jgi:carbon monoxide dehydrogenase subunit G